MREKHLESLSRVRPQKCSFELDVPSRNASWYSEIGYEPLSSAIFRSACLVADVVIDIGSHVGYYSLLAASTNPDARVIAIEASPENASVISSNADSNHHKVEVWNAAFINIPGSINFKITEASDNCGISGHPDSPTVDEIKVKAITGMELEISPGQRLVIKIDVEGHELSVLAGLDQVLAEANDVRILIEFNPRCILAADNSPSELLEWIKSKNFRMFSLDEKEFQWKEVSDSSFGENADIGYLNLWCIPADIAMTVCAVMHSAGLGGAGRSHVEVVESLLGAGCMVNTIMPAPDYGLVEQLQDVGSSTKLVTAFPWWVIHKGDPFPLDAKSFWQTNLISSEIIEIVRSLDPDVVLTQTIVVPQGAIAALALGKPHVWWIREFADVDHDLQLPLSPTETGELIFGLSEKVLTNSAAVRDYFFPLNPEMASIIHPIPPFRSANVLHIRPKRSWTIGIVGTLQSGKGQAEGIYAVAKLISEGYGINLVCIGGGSEQDLKQLQQLADQLGISDKVSFVGHLNDIDAIYGLVDAIAVTSRAEAFGRTPFEATDAGIPVVYSKCGGMVEYMVEGETGLAYEPGDIEGLADAIELLATNSELGLRLVNGARAHFKNLRNNPSRVASLVGHIRKSRDVTPKNSLMQLDYWILKSAVAERDNAVAERDNAVAERDNAVAERDNAVAERDSVFGSTTWVLFRPYRGVVRIIRRLWVNSSPE
jgi:FkbM family methyltransferase